MKTNKLLKLLVKKNAKIKDALLIINQTQKGIVLVVDNNNKLLGTVTDGDMRRSFLKGYGINDSIEVAIKINPIVAPVSLNKKSRLELMKANDIFQLPIIDKNQQVVDIDIIKRSIDNGKRDEVVALLMAGGIGKRLRPITNTIPKPMIKIDNKPILEITIKMLKKVGFNKILLNIRYLKEQIVDYFEDGSKFGLEIIYINEPKPLGTAGSLGLIPDSQIPKSSFLVINGDLLTPLNYMSFREFHIAADYDFTLCGRPYEVHIPFGYPKIEGDIVTSFEEKPTFHHLVNSGIYCLSPEVLKYVKPNEYLDMPDLIRTVIEKDKKVGVFPLRERFHEIGRPESLEKAESFYFEYIKDKL